jgi:hypothetical protein
VPNHRSSRRYAALLAAPLQPRSQPDRTDFRQVQGKAKERSIPALYDRIGRALETFQAGEFRRGLRWLIVSYYSGGESGGPLQVATGELMKWARMLAYIAGPWTKSCFYAMSTWAENRILRATVPIVHSFE